MDRAAPRNIGLWPLCFRAGVSSSSLRRRLVGISSGGSRCIHILLRELLWKFFHSFLLVGSAGGVGGGGFAAICSRFTVSMGSLVNCRAKDVVRTASR